MPHDDLMAQMGVNKTVRIEVNGGRGRLYAHYRIMDWYYRIMERIMYYGIMTLLGGPYYGIMVLWQV